MSLVITVDEQKQIEVQRFEGNLQTGKRKLYTDDFVKIMLDLMNEKELLTFLLEKNYIEHIKKYLDKTEEEGFLELVNVVLHRIQREEGPLENNLFYISLMKELMRKVDIQLMNPSWLGEFLDAAISNTKQFEDENAKRYQELVLLLLKKGQVVPEINVPILSAIFKVAANKVQKTSNKEEIRTILEAISEQVSGEWVEQVLAKEGHDRVIYNGFMPKNILFYQKTFKKEIVVIDVPKGCFDIKYHDVIYKNVGHPRMLFIFIVGQQTILDINIVAVKDKIISEDTALYHYPFSNVFPNGRVCWSFNQYQIDSLEKLQHIPYIFLSTPNNTHLSDNAREIYSKNEGKDFEEEHLKPMGVNLKEFLEGK